MIAHLWWPWREVWHLISPRGFTSTMAWFHVESINSFHGERSITKSGRGLCKVPQERGDPQETKKVGVLTMTSCIVRSGSLWELLLATVASELNQHLTRPKHDFEDTFSFEFAGCATRPDRQTRETFPRCANELHLPVQSYWINNIRSNTLKKKRSRGSRIR